MKGLRLPATGPIAVVTLALVSSSPVRAQTESPEPSSTSSLSEAQLLQLHQHPLIMTVEGVTLEVPTRECGSSINQALAENRTVPVGDDACRQTMLRALEIKRTAPPVETEPAIAAAKTIPLNGALVDIPEGCSPFVDQALMQNSPVPVQDDACARAIQQALDAQNNNDASSSGSAVPQASHLSHNVQ